MPGWSSITQALNPAWQAVKGDLGELATDAWRSTQGAWRAPNFRSAQDILLNGTAGSRGARGVGAGLWNYYTGGGPGAFGGGSQMGRFGTAALRIGATGVGLGAAGRILSGGGLYKDRYGNTDIMGVPFI